MEPPASNKNQPDHVGETYKWWNRLIAPPEPGKPSNRGELAELRRCKTLEEVLFVPAYHRLHYRLRPTGWSDRISIAAVAGLLAHVKGDIEDPRSVGAFLAKPTKPGFGPRVSELRFQRFAEIRKLDDLYPALLRIIHLAGDRVPVRDLIDSIRKWDHPSWEHLPRHPRREWTFHYYSALLEHENFDRAKGA